MPKNVKVLILKLQDLNHSQSDNIGLTYILSALSDLNEKAITALYRKTSNTILRLLLEQVIWTPACIGDPASTGDPACIETLLTSHIKLFVCIRYT